MNLQQLRYVVATADEGSMTAAARAVHVAQPALSRAVRALENELGVEIFATRGRTVELTESGRRIVNASRRVLDDVTDLEALALELADAATLTLTSTPTLENAYTAPTVARYMAMHPEVSIAMQRANGRDEVLALVRAGATDLGIADFDEVPEDLEVWPLDRDEVVLIAPPDTDLPPFVTLATLDGLPLIVPGHDSSRRAELDALFERAGVTPKVAIESDERATWVDSMLLGIGSFLGYRSHATALAKRGAVVRAFRPSLARTIGVAHRPGAMSKAARAFVDCARESVSEPRATA
jgi:DNA-binding transcriptional LysR family regulator